MSDPLPFDFAAFRASLHKLAHPNTEDSDARKLTQKVIETSLDTVANIVGVSSRPIVTVRERSGFREERLRHVYAFPQKIREWFDTKDREWFDTKKVRAEGVESLAFNDPRAKHKCAIRLDGPTCRCVIFDIAGKKVTRRRRRGVRPESHIFPDRIDDFLRDIASDKSHREVIAFDQINGCLVFGISRTNSSRQIIQMVALYVMGLPDIEDLCDRLEVCAHIVAEMFRTVKEIQVNERLKIERQALNNIVGLVSTFADENISPSDSVAALLKTFDEIFDDHGYFGPNRYLSTTKKDEKPHQWVTFLSINYRESDKRNNKGKGEPPTPLLAIYPKSKATDDYVQSYRVSRPDVLSISKYLLYKFLKQHDIPTPKEFHNRFKNVDVKKEAFHKVEDIPLGLVLVKNDHDWEDLQFYIFGHDTKTTAAFLLRRSVGDDNRPFAILVFESDHADAFSRADIELISHLVDASASLLSNSKLGNHSIDYSAQLKKAFEGRTNHKIGNVRYTDIAYELLRFDHKAATEILKCTDADIVKRLWNKNNKLKQKKVRDLALKVVQRIDELEKVGGTALNKWLWNNEAYNWINEKWGKNIKDIHEFLIAVPANDIWHCYLGSIGRALADRQFKAPDELPTFRQFQPGYSAMAMFVVDATYQSRQIAKLTTKDKLQHEHDNYTKYVRYKIPLAARIPANGTAFDTIGTAPGENRPENDGYGVIVSDLIAGRNDQVAATPLSFLSICGNLMDRDDDDDYPKIGEVLIAIKYHFMKNVRIWKLEGHDEWVKKPPTEHETQEIVPLIEEWTCIRPKRGMHITDRKEKNIENRWGKIAKDLSKEPELVDAILHVFRATQRYYETFLNRSSKKKKPIEFDKMSKISDFVEEFLPLRKNSLNDRGELNSIHACEHIEPSFVHGDLNGNNLTWAAHYKRFVMIDFEKIDLGFVGLDQLKLIASMICETVPTIREKESNRIVPVLDTEHHAMIDLIKLVLLLISDVIGAKVVKARTKKLANLSKIAKDKDSPLLIVALEIISTIHFEELKLESPDEQLFWKLTLRNLFYRQFEYAFRDIGVQHIEALKQVSESIDEILEKHDKLPNKGEDTVVYLNKPAPNVLKNANEDSVIMFFYSFLTLLGTL